MTTDRPISQEWLLWQLADSAFPAGGFAHSAGLEAARQHGQVGAGPSLASFLKTSLAQAAHGAAPFVVAAHREPARFEELDLLCDVQLTNHVANRASRALGRSLLAAAERIFAVPVPSTLSRSQRRGNGPGHFAPVFGVVARTLEIDVEQTARLFLFITLRGLVSAAVRLGVVGPMEGQAVQFSLGPAAERLASESLEIPPDEAAQTAPFLDLLQGTQDRLYSRLFQS